MVKPARFFLFLWLVLVARSALPVTEAAACPGSLSQLAAVSVDVYRGGHSESKPISQLKPGEIVTNVHITRPSGQTTDAWTGSSRGWGNLWTSYSHDELSPEVLKGKKVLDVACGYGILVDESRKEGVEMYGLDIAGNWKPEDWYHSLQGQSLPKENLVLDAKSGAGYFVRADAAHTGLQGGQFDAVLSNWGPFNYDTDPAVLSAILSELARITKPGGKIYLYGLNEPSVRLIEHPEVFHLRTVRGMSGESVILETPL